MSEPIRTRAAFIAHYAGIGALWPFLPLYYASRGLDVAVIGALAALAAGASMIAGPAWGAVADRSGTRRVLIAAPLLTAIAATALAFSPTLPAIVLAIAVLSLGLAGIAPVLDATALATAPGDPHAYGRIRVWGSVSFIAASLVVGALVGSGGPQALFLALVPSLLLTGLIGSQLRVRIRPTTQSILSGTAVVLRQPVLAAILVAALCTWGAQMAVAAFQSLYLASLAAPAWLIGAGWAVGAVAELPVMWSFRSLAARFGVERLLILGACMFLLRAGAWVILTDPLLLVASNALSGVGFALFLVGSVTYVADHAPAGLAATAQGVLTGVSFGLATVAGSVFGGLIASAVSIRGLFVACFLFGLVAIASVVIAVRVGHTEAVVAPREEPSSSVP